MERETDRTESPSQTYDFGIGTEADGGGEKPCFGIRPDLFLRYVVVTIFILGSLLLTDTALLINQHKGGTMATFCHNITLPSQDNTQWLVPFAPVKSEGIRFSSNSSHCQEKHAFSLTNDIYVSVCDYKEAIRVDIRRFIGSIDRGISPTIRGIYLSQSQWAVLKSKIPAIDWAINEINTL